jgi:hypothetical protein
MTKIKIWKTIYFDQIEKYPTWGDIKYIKFEDDDRIAITYNELDYSDISVWNIQVEREVEETDGEYERRMERKKSDEEYQKKRNYKTYLRLKKQFDNE